MFQYTIDEEIELRLIDLYCAEESLKLINENRLYLRKWLPWVDDTTTIDDITTFIKATKQQFANDNGFQAGIWYQNQLVGIIGFQSVSRGNRSTSLGYWLAEPFQGKGIMTKACKALINYAFTNMNIHRIEIRCAEENFKSRAIPERLNFKQEGLIRDAEWLYDHYASHYVYGMLKDDWVQEG